jgi:EAL and modified HD-GYP domain-containing signal transduction protein
MATLVSAAKVSRAMLPPEQRDARKRDTVRYVARQAILDLSGLDFSGFDFAGPDSGVPHPAGRVLGYELLFRHGREPNFHGDGDLATRTMLDNTITFGLERLTGGLTAFVNCTRDALTGNLTRNLADILPPSLFVLEILETIEPTPAVVEACRCLKRAGFRLALDDFRWKPELAPLLELADYVKVDFTLSGPPERRTLLEKLRDYPAALIAEKIETAEELRQARDEGFLLIQGYYFSRPQLAALYDA